MKSARLRPVAAAVSMAMDAQTAALFMPPRKPAMTKKQSGDMMAFDRASVRTIDLDGRLRVEVTNISKANCCPYAAEEIPGWQDLGLEAGKVYTLYRDPDELAKAAPSFNAIPLLSIHKPVATFDSEADKGLVIGATGTDAVFEAPYLRNSLVVWDAAAIRRIESEETRELSSAYRFQALMEPGVTEQGDRFDGRMVSIVGSHVALVEQGRAGPDVLVGDSALSNLTEKIRMKTQPPTARALMARGALLRVADGNLLATDAKPDFAKIAAGVPAKGKAAPGLLDAIKPHLAQDADIEEVRAILDLVDAVEEGDLESTVAEDDASPDAFLKGKLSEEDYAKYKELCAPAAQDEDKDGDKPKDDEKKDDDMKNEPKGVTAQAMDAAIKSAVKAAEERATSAAIKLANDIDAARRDVRPAVGDLHLAADSADGVYAAALKTLGVSTEGMEPSAYRHVFAAHASAKTTRTVIAQDAAPSSDFDKAFGSALSVKTV